MYRMDHVTKFLQISCNKSRPHQNRLFEIFILEFEKFLTIQTHFSAFYLISQKLKSISLVLRVDVSCCEKFVEIWSRDPLWYVALKNNISLINSRLMKFSFYWDINLK